MGSLAEALPAEGEELFSKLDDDSMLLLCLTLDVRDSVALASTCKATNSIRQNEALWTKLAQHAFGAVLPAAASSTYEATKGQWRLRTKLRALMSVGRGDISNPPLVTGEKFGAIGFPTNPGLMSPGIPGALQMVHRRAGPELAHHLEGRPEFIAAQKSDFGGLMLGNAITTPSFNLAAAANIIHAVGPLPGLPPTPKERLNITLLAYRAVFDAMDANGLSTLALSAIGTGLAGVAAEDSADIAVQARAARTMGTPHAWPTRTPHTARATGRTHDASCTPACVRACMQAGVPRVGK